MTNEPTQARRRRRLWIALLLVLSLVVASCSSSDDDATSADTQDSGETDPATEADEAAEPDEADDGTSESESEAESEAEPDEATVDEPLELGRGVTEDTITIGYSYLNLDDLRERGVIDLNHGPYPDHVQTMLDHINAEGGIHGRTIEVVMSPFSPVDPESIQAGCLELTEDNEVFAVLGAFRGDAVLCYTEQHDTAVIANAGMTQERFDRSGSPYVAIEVAQEAKVDAFVTKAVELGLFDGRTLAVHSTDAVAVAEDNALPALSEAGVEVAFESLVQGDGSVGGAAAEVALNVESMRARNIDTVVIVGDAIVAINTFIGEGFFPNLLFLDQGSAHAVALRTDMSEFPEIHAFGSFTDVSRFEEPTFQNECLPVWDAAHPDDPVRNPVDVPVGEANHVVGLGNVCRALTIFTAIAEAAGPNLNNDTFAAAIDTVGEFTLPGTGAASLGTGKYSAQDNLLMWVFDPANSDSNTGFVVVE